MKIKPLLSDFKIVKLDREADVRLSDGFFSLTKDEEGCFSMICEAALEEECKKWRCLKIDEVLDFSLTGILNNVLQPISDGAISVLVISAYDTDYIFVEKEKYRSAIDIMIMQGFINA